MVHKQIMNSFKHQTIKLVAQAMTRFYGVKVAVAKMCKELFQLTGSSMVMVKKFPLLSTLHTSFRKYSQTPLARELLESVMPLTNMFVFLPILSVKNCFVVLC